MTVPENCINCTLDKVIAALEAIGAVESATGGNYLLESGVAKVVAEIISGHEECHAKEVTLGYLEEMAATEPVDRYWVSIVRNLLAAAKRSEPEVRPVDILPHVTLPVVLSELSETESGDVIQRGRVVVIPFLMFRIRISITREHKKEADTGVYASPYSVVSDTA